MPVPEPFVFDTNYIMVIVTVVFNAGILWLLTKQNSVKLEKVATNVEEMKLQQVRDQAINSSNVDQIKSSVNVCAALIEKVERSSQEHSLNIRTLQEKIMTIEKKVS